MREGWRETPRKTDRIKMSRKKVSLPGLHTSNSVLKSSYLGPVLFFWSFDCKNVEMEQYGRSAGVLSLSPSVCCCRTVEVRGDRCVLDVRQLAYSFSECSQLLSHCLASLSLYTTVDDSSFFFLSFGVSLSFLTLFSLTPPLSVPPLSLSLQYVPPFLFFSVSTPPLLPSFFFPSLLAAVPKWAGGPRHTQHRAEQRAIQRLAN